MDKFKTLLESVPSEDLHPMLCLLLLRHANNKIYNLIVQCLFNLKDKLRDYDSDHFYQNALSNYSICKEENRKKRSKVFL